MTLPLLALPSAVNLAQRVAGKAIDLIGNKASSATSNAASKLPQALQEKLAKLDEKTRQKIEKTASDFETLFLETSLNQITATTGDTGPLGENGTGGDTYRTMLTNGYAKSITKSGGVGIANNVMAQMIKMQEAGQEKA